jgi:hypothetical protein
MLIRGARGKRFWLATAVVVCGGALACGANLKAASSGQIGCAEADITITDDSTGWSSRTWTAECHGKRFFCSAIQTGKNQNQVNCEEEADQVVDSRAAPPAAASTANGCQYDTQCKGDRVCVNGACVAPPAQGTEPVANEPTSVSQPGADKPADEQPAP